MPSPNEFAPAGAATLSQAAKWLGMSRNVVADFLENLDVMAASGKYPWHRLLSGVLGVAPASDEIDALTQPMLTLAHAAAELGLRAPDLKKKFEAGEISAPPLYAFGPRSRRFIASQFRAFARSPRGAFVQLDRLNDFTMTLPQVAKQFPHLHSKIEQLRDVKDAALPSHIIMPGGKKLFLRSAVLKAAKAATSTKEDAEPDANAASCQGDRAPLDSAAEGIFVAAHRAAQEAGVAR